MCKFIQTHIHDSGSQGNPRQIKKLEKGQSFLELSFILIILLLILSGIVDLGRAIFINFAMQDAASEGIVYGTSFPTDCNGIRIRVGNNLANARLGGGMTVEVQIQDKSNGFAYVTCEAIPISHVYAGELMRITVTKSFNITMPLIGAFIGQTIPLSTTSQGIILRPQPPNPTPTPTT